ncbi:Nmad3 family putative nucleotide modification protein [Pseudomonas sp. OTU5201]|uniref:Nmad3 family putative nucleotide modification protein n=1 Tax=Pseudomonas sp. OTU5201 TaxID=3043850 RepID=UPI00313DB0BD
MRVILSRKGFDSSAGGCPSPILPDGRLCSLPIPDEASSISYGDIDYCGTNLGELVCQLTLNARWQGEGAHLDPDLRADALPRLPGWTPTLGQSGSAQGHLRNEGVTVGDLFLFFGTFRPVQQVAGGWRFSPRQAPCQVIWGWLQVGKVLKVDELLADPMPWVRYHPHFAYGKDASNTLYLATKKLSLDGIAAGYPGAGTFAYLDERLVLTASDAKRQTRWRLPAFFAPGKGQRGLSFHRNPNRWTSAEDGCLLDSAFRGQEFVLDMQGDERPLVWIRSLLAAART